MYASYFVLVTAYQVHKCIRQIVRVGVICKLLGVALWNYGTVMVSKVRKVSRKIDSLTKINGSKMILTRGGYREEMTLKKVVSFL